MKTDAIAHNPVTLRQIATTPRDQGLQPFEVFRQLDISPLQLLASNSWTARSLCIGLGAAAARFAGDPFFGPRAGTFSLAARSQNARFHRAGEIVRETKDHDS